MTAATTSAVAPPAPGRLGVAVEPAAALAYLEALGRWRDDRRKELDVLDGAALRSPDQAEATADIALSLAVWKAISDRLELLGRTWNSGRVGPVERERMSALIWGRLDATVDPALLARSPAVPGSGLAVSLPEACSLSDALATRLRVRLRLEESGLVVADRVAALRAQLERIRDQVGLEPAGSRQQQAAERQSRLARRLAEVADKAGRGGDVGGLLGPLELDATGFERDLIVGAATRREAGAKVTRARELRADLEAREAALRALVERCVATVAEAPRQAVPSVHALGPVPNTVATLDPYLRRLDQVARALAVAHHAYQSALDEHAELHSRLELYRAKARALGRADDPDVARAYQLARAALDHRPTRMAVATQAVRGYQACLTDGPSQSRPG